MFKGILNAMNSIHILLSLLLVHIVTAQSWHGFGDSLDHSHNKRSPPAPGGDGICYTHIVQENDTCAKLSKHYQITTSNIETWNLGSWDWPGCAKLKQGNFICLSSGALPMPVALPHAVCGPQVPGTRRPAKYSNLASLNPCPSNQCVSVIVVRIAIWLTPTNYIYSVLSWDNVVLDLTFVMQAPVVSLTVDRRVHKTKPQPKVLT